MQHSPATASASVATTPELRSWYWPLFSCQQMYVHEAVHAKLKLHNIRGWGLWQRERHAWYAHRNSRTAPRTACCMNSSAMRPPNNSPLKRVNLPWQLVSGHCMWDTSDDAVRRSSGASAWRLPVTDRVFHCPVPLPIDCLVLHSERKSIPVYVSAGAAQRQDDQEERRPEAHPCRPR